MRASSHLLRSVALVRQLCPLGTTHHQRTDDNVPCSTRRADGGSSRRSPWDRSLLWRGSAPFFSGDPLPWRPPVPGRARGRSLALGDAPRVTQPPTAPGGGPTP